MYDCIVIGAGPSGLMATGIASKTKKILVIEKNKLPGNKLMLTGKGRCNVTNNKNASDFLHEINHNSKFLSSSIYDFGPKEIIDFFESRNVILKEEDDNKIFPQSNKALDILNCLKKEAENAEFKYEESVLEIKSGDIKKVVTDKGIYESKNVIIATGGASYPQTGSSGDHLIFAEMLKQPVVPLYPVETSVVLENPLKEVGTAIDNVEVFFEDKKTSGTLMITHTGLSGSSIMKISEFIAKSNTKELYIDLLPSKSIEQIREEISLIPDKELVSFFQKYFSKKFSGNLQDYFQISKKIKQYSHQEIMNIIKTIKYFPFVVSKVSDLKNAFVTGGGIDTLYINSTTMESTINPGIYFIGESLDVHGPIGGYNITIALSTGHLAGSKVK